MTSSYKYQNYIYRGKNNKLVLHDFIYEQFYMFKFSGNDNLNDFALDFVRKIATRMHIWQIHNNEINSNSLDFYIALYKYIEHNGGLKNCDKLSEYTYNINSYDSLQELVNSKTLIKEEVYINNQELFYDENFGKQNNKILSITSYNIIRDSSGCLIIPDEIYNECINYKGGDNPYQFGNYISQKLSDNYENITDELVNYYISIFKLMKTEKYYISLSEFCKKNNIGNIQEMLPKLLNSKQLKMYVVNMNINGHISENQVENIKSLENTAYNVSTFNTNNETENINIKTKEREEKDLKSHINSEIQDIEISLRDIRNNINSKTEEGYANNKQKLCDLRIKIENTYKKVKEQSSLEFMIDKNIIRDTEKKYKEITSRIEKLSEKLEKINTELNKEKNNDKTDYYEQIETKLQNFETELNTITQDMKVNSEKDYTSIHAKLSSLRDSLHDFYSKSLKEAHQNGSLTGPLLKEATTKHNELMNNINSAMKTLESLKKKLLFKNLFNG